MTIQNPAMRPLFIGVSGRSCSGKTTSVTKFAQSRNDVRVMHMDDYYLTEDEVQKIGRYYNWDSIASLNMKSVCQDIRDARCGIINPSWKQYGEKADSNTFIFVLEGSVMFDSDWWINQLDHVIWINEENEELLRTRRLNRVYPDYVDAQGYYDQIVVPFERNLCKNLHHSIQVVQPIEVFEKLRALADRI